MRVLLQRVTRASVHVGGEEVGRIGRGLVAFVGVAQGDTESDVEYLADKVSNLRIFPDSEGRFNISALEAGAEMLLVSQFTLHADTRKGRRPSFSAAASPQDALPLFDALVRRLKATGLNVETGRFQEHMLVEIHNDGPVTVLIDSADRHLARSGRPKPGLAAGAAESQG